MVVFVMKEGRVKKEKREYLFVEFPEKFRIEMRHIPYIILLAYNCEFSESGSVFIANFLESSSTGVSKMFEIIKTPRK